ncbi:hypothetical protein ACUYFE_01990 [Olegusella massiliensis]|uniref:hypothetical protein n=1 Tax=Olegusella massiliensis TaxID=1776381 RepID=UPI0028E3200E|nr:hypothetical protein [Olegusella massiliensis]
MNDKLYELQQKINLWMQGRNGADTLSNTSIWLGIILYIIGLISHVAALNFIALVLVVYAFFRMTSRSLDARAKENKAFLKQVGPLRPWFKNPAAAWNEFRSYKHFKCPHCAQRMRVPRGRGKLRVSCPKCHHKFECES